MESMTEPSNDASAAAALDDHATALNPDVASCSSDTSESSDDEVEPTTEGESASSIRENPYVAQLIVLSTQYSKEMEAYQDGCKCQDYSILQDRLNVIDGTIEYLTQQQNALQAIQERAGRFQEDLMDAASDIKLLNKDKRSLCERRRVQDMVIGRLVRSKEDLTIENRDLKSKLGLVAGICRGFTETETANQGHMINRDTQASIDSNMEGRARKRTRQATANRLQNRLPPHSRQDSQPHLQKISKSRDVMIW